ETPVPSEHRLVTVVAGNPAVSVRDESTRLDRNGAASACAARSSAPRPSTRNRQVRSAGGMPSGLGPSRPSDASSDRDRSGSDPAPYAGTRGPLVMPQILAVPLPGGIGVSGGGAGGGFGERLGEGQDVGDRLGTVGRLADAQGQVVGGDGAGVAVVGLAVLVAAGGRLQVDVGDGTPPYGERHLRRGDARDVRGRLRDDSGDRHRLDAVQLDGLGGGGGVRRRDALHG